MTENKLPKCDCFDLCGDDPWLSKGKAEYCDDHKAKEKKAALTEVIRWTLIADALPPDDTLVMGFFSDDDVQGVPVFPCLILSQRRWYIADGMPTEPPIAWAPMPAGPRNTPWMKVRSK